ncbi:MAG TPA: TlyA family RNA methyltransferase [Rhabdaerophilum sp.]|nr:TlyA family RNA methyltransferase [Rhabdaerophilum sp.]
MSSPRLNALRLDQALVERGLAASRARAAASIAAGLVKVDGVVARKASQTVHSGQHVEAQEPFETVSRAGLKLKAALEATGINPAGLIALDLGASTGGFTDLLLQRGARKVYAVDVGHGQLHPRLLADPRVVNLEGIDARKIDEALVRDPIDLLVADLSFIGLAKAIPAGLTRLKVGAVIVLLIKPQFEAGPGASKNGIIRDGTLHDDICRRVADEMGSLGVIVDRIIPSPIAGGDGNREFLLIGHKA